MNLFAHEPFWSRWYYLDDTGQVQPCRSLDDVRHGAGDSQSRIVDRTEIGAILISTVFLGLDHNFSAGGPPVLWETMVFGGPLDQEMDRYTSVEDARDGHTQMVAQVRAALAREG